MCEREVEKKKKNNRENMFELKSEQIVLPSKEHPTNNFFFSTKENKSKLEKNYEEQSAFK